MTDRQFSKLMMKIGIISLGFGLMGGFLSTQAQYLFGLLTTFGGLMTLISGYATIVNSDKDVE